ncbi:MAG: flagellar hook-associated protein FlgK [Pseudomonadota bacterium]
MSMNGILNNALSGLQAAQLGMRTASNNVANVNTPGYARTETVTAARNLSGQGMGVEVVGVRRVTDIFLQAATMRAASDRSEASTVFTVLDRLQAQLGSTNDPSSLFGRMNQAFASLGSASLDPTESVSRLSAASDLQTFFDEASRLSGEVRALRSETDLRISTGVERINEILTELEQLNGEVGRLDASGADVTGAANRQSELLDELSTIIDVRADRQSDGRLFVRTADGVGLLDNARLTLNYVPSGSGAYGVDYGRITAEVSSSGATVDLTPHISSGELRGLMKLRDDELPAIADQIAEFASGVADALNAAHNDGAAFPPPNTLEGRQTGLVSSDILTGSGQARLAVVAADGSLVRSVDITVGAGGFDVDGNGAPLIFDLVTELNTAFAGDATASFVDGRLTVTATDPSHGVAAAQDEADPSSIGGRGFAHFFGLNDIVDSRRPSFFETGLEPGSNHQMAAGGEIGFTVSAPDGRRVADITVPVAGATIQDQLNALNAVGSGLGQYGSFGLDANGAIGFTPAAGYESFAVDVANDTTLRGGTGLSFTQVFGLGDAARMSRAEGFEVASEIRSDSGRLSFAKLDLTGASIAGDTVLTPGDGRAGQELAAVASNRYGFEAAGGLAGGQATLEEYAARLAGDIGARAARAERQDQAAQSVQLAAGQKRADVEGVNLDEELALMTLYQQAYNASARLLQASKEMTDTLLNIV